MGRAHLLALGLLIAAPAVAQPWATGESRPEDITVSLVTFGPGPELISWWGHTALSVEDRRLNVARIYNYGMFSFDEGMLRRFALGRLEFWVGESHMLGTYQAYKNEGRDVRLQELNLSPARRMAMAKALAVNVMPGNREYLYHHYNDNCSTRPRDQIDAAVGGALKQANSGPGRMTLREHTRRYTAVSPPMSVFLDFMMNSEIDRPIRAWDEAFLPDELERQVDALEYTNESGERVPLVAKKGFFFKSSAPPVPQAPPAYGPWLLLLGLVLGAGSAALGRLAARGRRFARVLLGFWSAVVGLVVGIPGTALVVMWLFTNHTVTYHNENLFLASPLTLAVLPLALTFAFGRRDAWRELWWFFSALSVLSVLGLALKVLPPFHQDNWRLIALLLPVNLGLAGAYLFGAAEKTAAARALLARWPFLEQKRVASS